MCRKSVMRLMSEHARKCAALRKLHGHSWEAMREYVEAATACTLHLWLNHAVVREHRSSLTGLTSLVLSRFQSYLTTLSDLHCSHKALDFCHVCVHGAAGLPWNNMRGPHGMH